VGLRCAVEILESLVEFRGKIELDRVVSRGDSLNIPFDEAVFGDLLDVVEVNDHEQGNRNEKAANN